MTFWYPADKRFEDLSADVQRRLGLEWGRQIIESYWFKDGMRVLDAIRPADVPDARPTWVLSPDILRPRPGITAGATLMGWPLVFENGARPHIRIDLAQDTTAPLGPNAPKDATP